MATFKPTSEMTTEEFTQYWDENCDEINRNLEQLVQKAHTLKTKIETRRAERQARKDEE